MHSAQYCSGSEEDCPAEADNSAVPAWWDSPYCARPLPAWTEEQLQLAARLAAWLAGTGRAGAGAGGIQWTQTQGGGWLVSTLALATSRIRTECWRNCECDGRWASWSPTRACTADRLCSCTRTC